MDETAELPNSRVDIPPPDRSTPHEASPEDIHAFREELAELSRRSLLERGQMSEIRERIKEVAERLSKLTRQTGLAGDQE